MTKVYVSVAGAEITVSVDGLLTSGMVGVPVEIRYDSSWDGLKKVAVFKNGDFTRKRDPVGTSTIIPWEILRTTGTLHIGIRGENDNGSVVIPTIWGHACKIQEGASSDILAAPNPDSGNGSSGSVFIDDSSVSQHSVWSSKNTVERLCPSFEKEGLLVQCEPVEGYPVSISFESSGETADHVLTVCGKNLYNKNAYPLNTSGYPSKNNGTFSTSNTYRRTGFINVAHLVGQTITLNYAPVDASLPGMAFYTRIPNVANIDDCKAAFCGGGSGYNITVPDEAVYMCFCVAVADANKDVQLEIGSEATEFEVYSEEKFSYKNELADSSVIECDPIPGKNGLNTFYVYAGETEGDAFTPRDACVVQISGFSNPRAEIRKLSNDVAELKNAILALGANV